MSVVGVFEFGGKMFYSVCSPKMYGGGGVGSGGVCLLKPWL